MSSSRIAEEDVLWVRWNPTVHADHPEIAAAIGVFEPGPRPGAQAATAWLRDHGLAGESQPYLAMHGDELRSKERAQLGLGRPTQGANLITQLVKSAQHGGDFDGGLLVSDALGVAQELAAAASATVVALDPYDEATDKMWRERFKMRPSRTLVRCGDGVERRRLFLPVRRP